MIKTYVGIADCYGLESFVCKEDMVIADMLDKLDGDKNVAKNVSYNSLVNAMSLRARYNSQRHTVLYMAKINSKDSVHIKNLLQSGHPDKALLYLKKTAKEIFIEKGSQRRWDKLPDSKLDPFE